MTIQELANITHARIKILSAKDGKVLCYGFSEEKHTKFKNREVVSLWAEIAVTNYAYSSSAKPQICVYVSEVSQ